MVLRFEFNLKTSSGVQPFSRGGSSGVERGCRRMESPRNTREAMEHRAEPAAATARADKAEYRSLSSRLK